MTVPVPSVSRTLGGIGFLCGRGRPRSTRGRLKKRFGFGLHRKKLVESATQIGIAATRRVEESRALPEIGQLPCGVEQAFFLFFQVIHKRFTASPTIHATFAGKIRHTVQKSCRISGDQLWLRIWRNNHGLA